MTKLQQPNLSRLDTLHDKHGQAVRQALANILNTQLAEFTYAQILDGLPTKQSLLESCSLIFDHPVCKLKHTSLCDEFLEKACEFRSRFDPSSLVFDQDVG